MKTVSLGERLGRNFCVFLSIVALGFLVSCATTSPPGSAPEKASPGKYTKWNGLIDELEIVQGFSIGNFSKVILLPIETASTPLPDKGDNTFEPVTMVLGQVDSIFMEGFKNGLKDVRNVSVGSAQVTPTGPGALIIKAKVITMSPGSKALRYFVGFGAGHSAAKMQGEVIDAQSSQVLLRFNHGRGSSIGIFGGDYFKMMSGDSKDVAEDLGKMLTKFQ